MTAGSSFTNLFGGTVIKPADPSYEALTIAEDTQLYWPLETTESVPVVAAAIDVTASAANLKIIMPPGNTGSNGVQTMFTNVGSNTFDVVSSTGAAIGTIATTQSWIIALTDNTTESGTWVAYQLAATTSSATAAALAGPGLEAVANKLQPYYPASVITTSTTTSAAARATAYVFTGGSAATLSFPASATLGVGWFCAFANLGTAALTLQGSGGELINGSATLTVEPGNSGLLVVGSGRLTTIGALAHTLTIAEGGTGATNATDALTNLGGTSLGITLFTAPSAASARAALGLTNTSFVTNVVGTDQTVSSSQGSTNFVCLAAVTLTLPLVSTLTTSFNILVLAYNGDVTLTPQGADYIQTKAVGVDYTIQGGCSVLLCNDGFNKWYVLYDSLPTAGGKVNGNVTVFGTLATSGAATIGAALAVTGTISVSGAAALGAGGTFTGGDLSSADHTFVSAIAPSSSGAMMRKADFPATMASPGSFDVTPVAFQVRFGSGTMTSGSGSVTYSSAFTTATLAVTMTIKSQTGTFTANALGRGTTTTSGFAVWGNASQTFDFDYIAIGH